MKKASGKKESKVTSVRGVISSTGRMNKRSGSKKDSRNTKNGQAHY